MKIPPMDIIDPKSEFRELSEDEVCAALRENNPLNPIMLEVARLISDYVVNFRRFGEQYSQFPAARYPIEDVVFRITSEAIRREINS